jgi:hypothetical protein
LEKWLKPVTNPSPHKNWRCMMPLVEITREDAAVLSAVNHIREHGYGRLIVEIGDGHVDVLEVNYTMFINRSNDAIMSDDHGDNCDSP